jgi:hypothetical protein
LFVIAGVETPAYLRGNGKNDGTSKDKKEADPPLREG